MTVYLLTLDFIAYEEGREEVDRGTSRQPLMQVIALMTIFEPQDTLKYMQCSI